MDIQAHSPLDSKLRNRGRSVFRVIWGLLVEDFGDKDQYSIGSENTVLLKEVILLGWQENKENQSCHP